MMHNPHDLHSWSRLYREDRLHEASRRRLAERVNAGGCPHQLGRFGLGRRKPPALLREA